MQCSQSRLRIRISVSATPEPSMLAAKRMGTWGPVRWTDLSSSGKSSGLIHISPIPFSKRSNTCQDIASVRICAILFPVPSFILPLMTPTLSIDRPLPWIHFRLSVEGWHPLVAMCQPNSATRWDELHELGITQVLRLSDESQPYDPFPLRMLGMIPLEDQDGEEMPTDPEFEEQQVNRAVNLLRSGLQQEGVAIHCVGGRGRTGTVIGGFLHSLGFPCDEICGLLDRTYQDAGRPGWPESPWQGEVIGNIRSVN